MCVCVCVWCDTVVFRCLVITYLPATSGCQIFYYCVSPMYLSTTGSCLP